MAEKDKPYKVYRGGRAKGPIRPLSEQAGAIREDGRAKPPKEPKQKRRRRWGWRRGLVLLLIGLIIVALVWALLGLLAVRRGVGQANERLDAEAKAAVSPSGSILTNPVTTLVIGADNGGRIKERQGTGRADSLILIRTDPDAHRISYLHIPRDLHVPIPGHANDRVNASYALGGPALAVETVQALTGVTVNHVVVVNFGSFRDVVDALDGITIQNPQPVLSKFECPFKGAERCATFKGWRFPKGELHLNGQRALIYSRIRKNDLNPGESDITRGERGQRVIDAIQGEVVGVSGFLRMPFIGDDIVKPLATDLSTGELLQLAWVRRRATGAKTLRCRLGGTPVNIGGADVLQSSEDNRLIVSMFQGESAPQRPPKGQLFSPGCFVGGVS